MIQTKNSDRGAVSSIGGPSAEPRLAPSDKRFGFLCDVDLCFDNLCLGRNHILVRGMGKNLSLNH